MEWHVRYRSPQGRILSGAANDAEGSPSWWGRSTMGQRIKASTREQAELSALAEAQRMSPDVVEERG